MLPNFAPAESDETCNTSLGGRSESTIHMHSLLLSGEQKLALSVEHD